MTSDPAPLSPVPSIPPAPTDPRLDELALQMLRIRRPEIDPLPADARILELDVESPPGWPDAGPIRVRVAQRGEGPAALVVHGWQGRPSDLEAITGRLLAAGHSVWLPDLPGHGGSGGAYLSIPLAARVLRAVGERAGPFAVAVAHSIGGACLVQALEDGLQADRVVLLAAPTHYGHFARIMGRKAGLDTDGQTALLARLGRLIGADPDHLDMARQAHERHEPVLLVHAEDDPIVPFQGAQRVASIWPGARWALFQDLGHTRPFLDDPAVGRLVGGFVVGRPADSQGSAIALYAV